MGVGYSMLTMSPVPGPQTEPTDLTTSRRYIAIALPLIQSVVRGWWDGSSSLSGLTDPAAIQAAEVPCAAGCTSSTENPVRDMDGSRPSTTHRRTDATGSGIRMGSGSFAFLAIRGAPRCRSPPRGPRRAPAPGGSA